MIEKLPFNLNLEVDTSRIKACHHNSNILQLMPIHNFYYELSVLGKRDENGEVHWFEDYSIRELLSLILTNKNFYDHNEEYKKIITAVAFESLCLIGVHHEYDWELHYSILDKRESEGVNNHQLVNDEIADVEEIVKLISIRDNFGNSEMTIKHRDNIGNIISKDNITIDRDTYKKFLDRYIKDKIVKFKIDNAYHHFGMKKASNTRKADLITSNSILSVRIQQGLEFKKSLDYFRKLLEQMKIYQMDKNKSARRMFTSLVVKSLMKFLNILLDEVKPIHTPKLKDKHLYIFYALRFFGFIPVDNEKLVQLSGNHSHKEDYIKDLLKMKH